MGEKGKRRMRRRKKVVSSFAGISSEIHRVV